MKTFRDLLLANNYKNVFNEIHRIFLKGKSVESKQNFDINFYNAWRELNKLKPQKESSLLIYLVEVPAEPEGETFIDVCMFDEEEDEIYSLDFMDWNDLMDMRIEKPDKMSEDECLAHILWEITFWGFSNKQVAKEKEKTKNAIKDNDKPL